MFVSNKQRKTELVQLLFLFFRQGRFWLCMAMAVSGLGVKWKQCHDKV